MNNLEDIIVIIGTGLVVNMYVLHTEKSMFIAFLAGAIAMIGVAAYGLWSYYRGISQR